MSEPSNGVQAIRNVSDAIDHAGEKFEKTAESNRRAYSFGIKSDFVKTVMQGGFALLVAYLFYTTIQSQAALVSSLIQTSAETSKEDRKMFGDESREQRKANWESTKLLREGLTDVKKAVEVNTAAVEKSGKDATEAAKTAAEEIRKLGLKKE